MRLSDLAVRFSDKKTFSQGVHPPEHKELAEDKAIEVLPNPSEIRIPLHQHTGAPSKAVVKTKQALAMGDLIAEAQGLISTTQHSSITGAAGMVTASTLPTGRRSYVVPIKVEAPRKPAEGEEPAEGPAPMPEGRALFEEMFGGDWTVNEGALPSPEEIIKAIQSAGIVGQGGAAFPTHVKVMRNPKKPVATVLLNGCECEPFLTSDYRLMLEAPAPIVAGLLIAMHSCGAGEGIIAIEDNKPEAIEVLRKAVQGMPNLRVAVVATKYPQGGEKQLIQAVLGKQVPTGGLPLDVGVVVVNVGTSAAVARAVLRGKPLTHRIVSVSGRGIANPKNLLVPVGVSIQALIDFCGGLTPEAARVVAGGPMMGFTMSDLDIPVTKGTSGITVLTRADLDAADATACVKCGRCVDVCPMNLVPTRIAMAAKAGDLEMAKQWDIAACMECGCCAFGCPARVPLVQQIRVGKLAIMRQARKN